jgi:hypothetical protein
MAAGSAPEYWDGDDAAVLLQQHHHHHHPEEVACGMVTISRSFTNTC